MAADEGDQATEEDLEESSRGYFESEKRADHHSAAKGDSPAQLGRLNRKEKDEMEGGLVDIVLSDMSAPWEQTAGFWKRSLSDPYYRMMNTSGMSFRDHAGSMVRKRVLQRFRRVTICETLGSVQCSLTLQLRNPPIWWTFCLQILPGIRGQSFRKSVEVPFCKGKSGETRVVS